MTDITEQGTQVGEAFSTFVRDNSERFILMEHGRYNLGLIDHSGNMVCVTLTVEKLEQPTKDELETLGS
jgi:hypothetical protein